MRFTFRLKLLTIVGSAALAFVLLTVASTLISNQVERQMATIEESYVPRLELGPQLERQFEGLRRAFQDAVAAQDTELLVATRGLGDAFLEALASARNAVNPADANQLREAVQHYYAQAYDVSRRLIAGETGEALVDGMGSMQAKQSHAADLLRTVTAFDKRTLTEAFAAAHRAQATATRLRLLISIACLAVVLALSLWVSRSVLRSLAELTAGFERYGRGEFSEPLHAMSHDELGDVAEKANQMAENLQRLREERDAADWLKTGQAGLAHELRGELEPEEAANRIVRFLARHLDAPAGALYSYSDGDALQLLGQYALSPDVSAGDAIPTFRRGEGLVGQAALQDEVMVISEPPAEYLRIRSGLGEGAARAIVLLPLLHAGKVRGVLELGLFKPWSDLHTDLLLSVRETAAIAIEVARARAAVGELLAETRRQSQRLATQEEELRVTNEELQAQQEELQQSNEELTQQTEELEAQRRSLEQKNAELNEAQRALEQKAKDLTTVSAYKSQFLANMSHELRTPLNSMLLLSNLLANNDGRNLTDKQVEYAKTIYGAGNDLLALINQVLDLARIESGKQDLRIESVSLRLLVEHAERVFAPLARDKGLTFVAELAPGLTDTILTDRQRAEQIVTNLLGNAIKFTERGRVELRVRAPAPGVRFRRADLHADRAVAFVVSDTGIGIAPEDQARIFTPFEQIEARTDRRYGGTGLGLSITHELASRLGGEVHLESASGTGSTFLCYLPLEPPAAGAVASASGLGVPEEQSPAAAAVSVARPAVEGEGVDLLIIEDDARFAEGFGDVIRGQGLKHLIANDGETGLRLAKEHSPRGIVLDVKLPDIDGWTVMERLRADSDTASIPVHFLSEVDASERGRSMGAIGYLTKPATGSDLLRVVEALVPKRAVNAPHRILVVADDVAAGDTLVHQLGGANLDAERVASAREALEALHRERFSCMVLDLSLPDMDGLELLQSLQENGGAGRTPPVIVYTGRALSRAEAQRLDTYAEAVVLKEGSSYERLLDEIRLFIRRLKDGLPPRRLPTPRLHPTDLHLERKKILVVDDDMRNVYALSALLRAKGVTVLVADTGRAALDVLAKHPDVEAVLMDIMMPEMDGYEAMRHIRTDKRFRELPIIALTAKAMKGDREKCLEAGACEYLSKPVDADRLIAMLHARLTQNQPHGA